MIQDGEPWPRPFTETVATIALAHSTTGRLGYLFFVAHIFPDLIADKEDGERRFSQHCFRPWSFGCLLESGEIDVDVEFG